MMTSSSTFSFPIKGVGGDVGKSVNQSTLDNSEMMNEP